MSENNAVSDNESIGSHPYDLDMNTHSSMFRYDNNTLGFVCRTLPGYTHKERKFGRLSVHALQASWRECRENDRTFEDVPGKFLKIIPPKKLPEFHRLKKEFIATVVLQEVQQEGGIILENDINPHNVINHDPFCFIPTFTETDELKEAVKTIYRERPEYEYVDPRIRRYISYCHCTPIVPTAEEGVFEYLAEQLADVFPNGRPDRIQCNRSSIVYKYTMPYHERFDMDDVPQDFAKSEVCKRYTSLLSMLNILYWYFETALIHRDLYTPLLRNCAQLLENGFVKRTHVLESAFGSITTSLDAGVCILCLSNDFTFTNQHYLYCNAAAPSLSNRFNHSCWPHQQSSESP